MRELETDVLVLGAGVAGLTVARALAGQHRVALVDAGPGSTPWAQGGIAAAVEAADDPAEHASDTQVAGVGVCDPTALTVLTEEGPGAVADLLRAGAHLDRSPDGRLSLGLEGGHHRRRVVHAGGDATGAEVHRVLSEVPSSVQRLSGTAVGLATGRLGRRVTGARIATTDGDVLVHARATVLATGGLGHAYARTTNPDGVDGSGLALALAAGAALTDVEFVQFHPTALATGSSGPLPLVSEAVRGEGAVLIGHDGARFMVGRHPLAELAPRDVVAREITRASGDAGHVWLDARGVEDLPQHFPTFVGSCLEIGRDPAYDLVPVTPAEHYLCGGVATDRWGATSVPGLYAVGEVAATGVHGANRLASNSLLEGLVFGRRLADRLVLDLPPAVATDDVPPAPEVADAATRQRVRELLTVHVAVERDASGLAYAEDALGLLPATDPQVQVARAVVAAATARTESRGTHHRRDFPATEARWARHLVVRLGADGLPEAHRAGLESAA